jgi:(R)-2-hydroxyacyl-CoA dehydratese activating ATPase
MPFCGIDIGSTMTKVVIADEQEKIIASHIGPTGAEHRHMALKVTEDTLRSLARSRAAGDIAGAEEITLENLKYIVATGYGRINVPFADKQITEITCHARGIRALFPNARIIIDIGGQDSKGIKLDAEGKVANFVMNDKCAAGTGRFLEVISETLGINLTDMGKIALSAEGFVQISNMCTVFAEHEVTSRLAEGAGVAEIVAGLHEAIAARVVNMTRHLGIEKDVVVTGGGAKNIGLLKAIEGKVGFPVLTPPEPFITGALGAALIGRDFYDRGVRPAKERKREDVTFFA